MSKRVRDEERERKISQDDISNDDLNMVRADLSVPKDRLDVDDKYDGLGGNIEFMNTDF